MVYFVQTTPRYPQDVLIEDLSLIDEIPAQKTAGMTRSCWMIISA